VKEDIVRALGRLNGVFYALMRLAVGLLYASHGAQKLFGLIGGHRVPLVSQMGLAGIIEFFCGLMIALGLLTGPAAFVASGEMAWAYFQFHAPRNAWPILNGGELAVALCFTFLYIASTGSGSFSVDRLLGRKV
jgi:putative oxidoreductase